MSADELAQQQIDLDRVARVWDVPRAFECHEPAAGRLRERRTLCDGADPVLVAMDNERWAPYARAGFGEQFLTGHSDAEHGVENRFGCGLHRPADAVLDLLARVRLGEAPREEELDEADVVVGQSAGGLGPLRVGFDRVLERGDIAFGVVGDERHPGPMYTIASIRSG